MRLITRLAFLALGLAPLGASADNSPQVVVATPGTGAGGIERFTLRFNQPIVGLGDPRAAAPAAVSCAVGGKGRWADQQTYVYEFDKPLPGGTTCKFDLVDTLKTSTGFAVEGQRHFLVDAGGPTARAVLVGGYGAIEEDQVFLVAANMAPIKASIGAAVYCAVEGVGEKIPVDVLGEEVAGNVLSQLGARNYRATRFLEEAGLPTTIPAAGADRKAALATVVALRCHRPLPPGRDMALIWGAGVAGAGGKRAGADQRFDFTVRKPFSARFECSRANPQAGCSPVEEAWVRFSAPIPMAQARAVRLVFPDGHATAPVISKEDEHRATIGDIRFAPPLPFATGARLVLPEDVRDESGRTLSNAARFPLDVQFDEAPPLVKFNGAFGILELKQGGILPVTVRNVEPVLRGATKAVSGKSLRVNGSDAEVATWLRRVDHADDYASHELKHGGETAIINDTGSVPILTGGAGAALSVPLPGKGRDFEVVGVPLTKPGFYVVELASPALGAALLGRRAPRYVATAALVTNMAVHFKWGKSASLAWVTTLDKARPVAGADVVVTDACTGKIVADGRSDAQGRLLIKGELPTPQAYGRCADGDSYETDDHPLMVSARKSGDFSFTLTSWSDGIRPDDFDLPYGYEDRGEIFHTVFDRALVREGEVINMKHIVRLPTPTGFGRTPGFTGMLLLTHSGSDTQFELPLKINANGVGETRWAVPKGAPQGDYVVSVVRGGEETATGQSFRVDEYRLPTMRATITGPKEAQVRPKSVPLDLFAGFLSGGGASNLPVDLRIGWFGETATPQGYEAYNFGGNAIVEGLKAMSGDGEDEQTPLPPTQNLPLVLGADGTAHTNVDVPATLDSAAAMRIEMDYQDANGQVLTARRNIALYPSAILLGVKTDGWLMKQDDLRLRFVTLDVSGKPVGGQKITVTLYARDILTARRRLIGGFYAYDNQMKTTKLGASCTATSDAQGLAQCKMAPGVSGEVFAVATTMDASGKVARATRSVWLAGDDDWWFGGDNGDRMDLVPERTDYKAGETAKFQVRMPFRTATALVTVEREGVLTSFVAELSGTNPVVEVPMPGSYSPDVFVSVLVVRGRVEPGWTGWLSRVAYALGLVAAPEPTPPPTALVDLNKPAYRLGIAKVNVGWEANRLGVTVKADRERYAVRDVAQVDVAVAMPGGKPAASADVAFVAVDEALLQLAPNDSWDVLSAMMGERSLSVLTSTAQTQVVGKRHFGKKAVAAGGGGGEGGDASGLNRENFQPVLLWKGRLPLDANGHARLAVPLSDALSAFRLVAIATDGDQFFGTGEAHIRAAQDLSVFSGIPPLVRTGDRFGAIFTLRNGSAAPMTVTARVDLTPAIAAGKPLTVTIPAGGAVPVVWNLTAPQGVESVRWHVRANSADGKAVDEISVDQQVVPAVPNEIWAATLARVGADTVIPISPPLGALVGRGSVDIRLDDTLSPPLGGVRAYMAAYPYDCFEQRLSRLVVLGDTAAWAALSGDIPTYQAPDGLLRYWPSETLSGSEALTAYVLSLTSEAGLALPVSARVQMIDALTAVVDGRIEHENYGDPRLRRLVAFTALARAGAATPAMLGQIGLAPADMPTAQLADYLVAIDRVSGLANAGALKAAAEAVLRKRLVYEGTRLDLSDEDKAAWWLMSSGDEAAIKALSAVFGRPGWQDDAARMMVGVAFRQTRGHWDTTTANAWGVVAARQFARLYPAAAIAGTTSVTLGTRRIDRAWPLAAPARVLSLPLPAAPAPLRLAQAGGAGPWATISVWAAVPLKAPLYAGYRLTRQVAVVQARQKGVLTRGDVLKVTLTVQASAERNWVVLSDPVPAGATIITGRAGQSSLLATDGSDEDGATPSYVETSNGAWRGYFDWLPQGSTTVSYTVRLNGTGRFLLPPIRVEAMYSPAIHAAVPNAPVTVLPK